VTGTIFSTIFSISTIRGTYCITVTIFYTIFGTSTIYWTIFYTVTIFSSINVFTIYFSRGTIFSVPGISIIFPTSCYNPTTFYTDLTLGISGPVSNLFCSSAVDTTTFSLYSGAVISF